jgi:hypothetical protein
VFLPLAGLLWLWVASGIFSKRAFLWFFLLLLWQVGAVSATRLSIKKIARNSLAAGILNGLIIR